MCGIVGYIGNRQAAPILLDGLAKLEYRGYDSAGIAVYNGEKIDMVKSKGRLKVLSELTHGGATLPGTLGIGHTRWATHGSPSDTNAHPHFNKDKSIVVVHNGIIENYLKLKKKLEKHGYEFVSETDTEVIAHLLDYYYKGNPLEAVTKIMHRMEGSYALGIIFQDHPEELYAVRKDSPLIVGHTEGGSILASDVPAVLKYTRDVVFIENEEIVRMTADQMEFFTVDEEPIEKTTTHIDWDVNAAEKGGYEHFMLKEMYEQPKAITDTFSPRIKDGQIVIEELGMTNEEIRKIRKIMVVACGSAAHAGHTSKYIFEGLARIQVDVDLASEFRYRDPILDDGTLVIVISQSGETADTLAALRESKKRGARVLGIVNVVGSSIAREADNVMYTWAGTGDCRSDHQGIFSPADRTLSPGHEVRPCKRRVKRRRTCGNDWRSGSPACTGGDAAEQSGEYPEICQPLSGGQRRLLYRKRRRSGHFHGRIAEAEGDFLYPFRSLCSRGIEAWNHFPD